MYTKGSHVDHWLHFHYFQKIPILNFLRHEAKLKARKPSLIKEMRQRKLKTLKSHIVVVKQFQRIT